MRIKILILLAALLFAAPAHAADLVGQPAPDLKVQELNGESFDLSAMRGQVVILHFWAIWCPSCKQEMPVLESFYQKHQGKIAVLAVSADKERHKDEVVAAVKPYHFGVALFDGAAVNGFGPPDAIPVTYIIDPAGVIRAKLTPDETPLSMASLEAAVAPLKAP